MNKQTMTRSEWVSSQLLTWHNAISAIAIFSIIMYIFIKGHHPMVIIGFFCAFFILTAWRMLLTMVVVSVIASGICLAFPFLAPVAFIIMVVLFLARIGFILKNWRAVIAGMFVYGLALTLYFKIQWIYTGYHYIFSGLRQIVLLLPQSLLHLINRPAFFFTCLAFTTLAIVIAFIFQMLLYWLYRNGYTASGALSIMGSIPLVIIALILPFLKAAAVDGAIADGISGDFTHDGAFAPDSAVSHDGFIKAPSGYHHVNGYTRIAPDGHTEYVHDYIRSNPDEIIENNLSYHGSHPAPTTSGSLPGTTTPNTGQDVPATGSDTYVMLAGSIHSASRPVFSARRHLILTLMAVYIGAGILTSTAVYFIYH